MTNLDAMLCIILSFFLAYGLQIICVVPNKLSASLRNFFNYIFTMLSALTVDLLVWNVSSLDQK